MSASCTLLPATACGRARLPRPQQRLRAGAVHASASGSRPPPMRDSQGNPNTGQMLVFVPPHPLIKHWLAIARNEARAFVPSRDAARATHPRPRLAAPPSRLLDLQDGAPTSARPSPALAGDAAADIP